MIIQEINYYEVDEDENLSGLYDTFSKLLEAYKVRRGLEYDLDIDYDSNQVIVKIEYDNTEANKRLN